MRPHQYFVNSCRWTTRAVRFLTRSAYKLCLRKSNACAAHLEPELVVIPNALQDTEHANGFRALLVRGNDLVGPQRQEKQNSEQIHTVHTKQLRPHRVLTAGSLQMPTQRRTTIFRPDVRNGEFLSLIHI